ncbi:AAA family ATPase [Dongia sp.]|uniref:AAA family ATPase n=1 Tax=Dongia sp. TaxID=1977262 RepID=UPI0035B351C3
MKPRQIAKKRNVDFQFSYRGKRPLTWWRHVVLEKIGDDDLPRFLRALEAGSLGKLAPELAQQALQDGDMALHAALALLPFTAPSSDDRVDLAMSWAMLAVSLGKEVAALLVAEGMRKIMERIDGHPWRAPPDAADIVRMRRRMHGWFQLSSVHNLFVDLREGTEVLGQAVGRFRAANNFNLAPVKSIPGGGRWGKEVASRYVGLTRPLILKQPILSPDHVELLLLRDSPSFASAIAAISDDLRLQSAGALPIARFRPILLLGKPGIGKTRFAKRVAHHLGLPLRLVSGAGGQTLDLAGLSRVYDSTQPSVVARTMLETGIANPVVLVDEVDKANPVGRERRFQDALLTMIDSETSATVPDECLSTMVDMAQVSWILTANDISGLSSPLLDRVRIFDVMAPDAEHLPMIIRGIIADLADDYRIPLDEMPELPAETIQELLTAYRAGASIRGIKRSVTAAISVSMRSSPDH